MILTTLTILLLILPTLLYVISSIVIPLIPKYTSFRNHKEGVKIQVISDGIHADLLLPVVSEEMNWWDFLSPSDYTVGQEPISYIGFGWGDKGFYLEIPEWSDLTLKVAARGMLMPSPTAMHITAYAATLPTRKYHHTLTIPSVAYTKLTNHIIQSFQKDDQGNPVHMPGVGYTPADNFYEGVGSYHAFNTCNTWITKALASAEVRTPIWTSSAQGLHWQLGRIGG